MIQNNDPDQKVIDKIVNLYNQGELENALKQSEELTLIYPKAYVFWNFVGACSALLGDLDKAIEAFQKVVALKPKNIVAYNNLGNVFQEKGNFTKAIEAYRRALVLQPDFAEAITNMGNVLQKQGKSKRALEFYKKSLSLKPHLAEAHFNMGILLEEQKSYKEAIVAYRKAIVHKPNYFESFYNLGTLLHETQDFEEALKAYKQAIYFKPDFAEAYNNLGNLLKDLDLIEEAIDAYRQAIIFKPDFAVAHRNISNIKNYKPGDEQIPLIQSLIDDPNIKGEQRCNLLYAFAKIKEDSGEFEVALNSYIEAGELRKKELDYDFQGDEQLFGHLKRTAPNLVKNPLTDSNLSLTCCPIFILGMPRSGTTLVEQIISSHSMVNAAGELPFLGHFGNKIATGERTISRKNLNFVRSSYLKELNNLSDGKLFVTDKMPHNFMYIGLICASIPEAKIIHIGRDPAATCWSNFKHYFPVQGLGYSYNLKDTVNYFELYEDLMSCWDELVGNRIFHLNYDELTVDQENQTKQLLRHLGLDWEASCLSPEKNKRIVKTASQLQIKQKVYKGSSESWKKFEPYLNGIFDKFFI